MSFPGAGAQMYYNDAGEPLGWDYPDVYVPRNPDRFEDLADAACEEAYERGQDAAEAGIDADLSYGSKHAPDDARAARWLQDAYNEGYAEMAQVSEGAA